MRRIVLIFAMGIVGCSGSDQDAALVMPELVENAAAEGKIEVEVIVYSGRPNPKWEITNPGELESLRRLLDQSPRAKKEEAVPPDLGSFHLINRGIPGFPEHIFVGRGTITIGSGQEIAHFKDVNRVEKFIAKLAKQEAKLEKRDRVKKLLDILTKETNGK